MANIFDIAQNMTSWSHAIEMSKDICDDREYDWLCQNEELDFLVESLVGVGKSKPKEDILDKITDTSKWRRKGRRSGTMPSL